MNDRAKDDQTVAEGSEHAPSLKPTTSETSVKQTGPQIPKPETAYSVTFEPKK